MDNITHSLAGALLGQMGLKRASRLAMAGCVLGANAPDIDVFAPFFLPVDNIAFHRGPTHALWAPPLLAAAIVGLLWLFDRWRPRKPGTAPFRPGPLFLATLLAVFSHPFLDWLTTYAVNLFTPFDSAWYSANAIFIVDWVYWLLLVGGILWSARRYRRNRPNAGRPAQVAGVVLLAYISGNVALSAHAERTMADALRRQGVRPTLVVASPPPFAFWRRTLAWRSRTHWGSGRYTPADGLAIDGTVQPLRLGDQRLVRARRDRRDVRSFLYWSRMPLVVEERGRAFLADIVSSVFPARTARSGPAASSSRSNPSIRPKGCMLRSGRFVVEDGPWPLPNSSGSARTSASPTSPPLPPRRRPGRCSPSTCSMTRLPGSGGSAVRNAGGCTVASPAWPGNLGGAAEV